MNKVIIAVVIVAVIVLGGYFLLRSPQYQAPSSGVTPQPTSQKTSPTLESPTTQTPVTQETPSAEQNVVTYNESGFSPSILRVKVGAAVVFKNADSEPLWVASNPHPIHTDYSGFDAKRGYGKGESYSFTFTKSGTWKYHNHLNPSEGGTIIIE